MPVNHPFILPLFLELTNDEMHPFSGYMIRITRHAYENARFENRDENRFVRVICKEKGSKLALPQVS